MFSFFKSNNFSNKNNKNIFKYLDELENIEKRFEEIIIEFNKNNPRERIEVSGEWFFSKEIKSKIKNIIIPSIEEFEEDIKKLNRNESFKIETTINSRIINIEKKLIKLNSLIKKNINKIKNNKSKEILDETYQIMKLFINDLHKFTLEIKNFPFNNLDTKIQTKILDDLRKKRIFLPDINYFQAKEMIKKYTDEELILVLQYLSIEKPYLFITKDKLNNLNRFILKSSINSNKKTEYNFLISKFLGLFEIRNYGVKYEHKYYENIKKYELKEFITFIKGRSIIDNDIFREKEDILKYSYFLGACIANGFFVNLSDRLVNIHYNVLDFNKIKYEYRKENLGFKNPIFHIDYDLNSFQEIKQYFTDIIFRKSYGLYEELLFNKVDLNICDILEVRNHFIEGFEDSINRLRNIYLNNKEDIDFFIKDKHQFKILIQRLNPEWIEEFKKIENIEFKFIYEEMNS